MKIKIVALMILGLMLSSSVLTACQTKEKELPKNIICVGDSITYGYGVSDSESYPSVLAQLTGENTRVLNYGVNGATGTADNAMSYSSLSVYELCQESEADAYVIMLGTNDARENFWDKEKYLTSMRSMLDAFKAANPNAEFYLMQPPAVFSSGINNDIIKGEVHDAVSTLAKEYKAKLIDLYALTENDENFFSDGVHPTADGYATIAQKVYDAIAD